MSGGPTLPRAMPELREPAELRGPTNMFVGPTAPPVARDLGSPTAPRPHDPAVARDLGSAADMFVGLALRGGPTVTLEPRQRGGHVRRPRSPRCPAVMLDLGSAADMFVGLAPRGSPR